jgi:hypothetical protein
MWIRKFIDETQEGKQYEAKQRIGIINYNLRYMEFSAQVKNMSSNQPGSDKKPIEQKF